VFAKMKREMEKKCERNKERILKNDLTLINSGQSTRVMTALQMTAPNVALGM
jgi:hypothetical protein